MVQKPVAHARLVDVARLRVADFEMLVAAVAVCSARQVFVERENVIRESIFKLLYVLLAAFPFQEFIPRAEQIIDCNDILVGMNEMRSHSSERTPPDDSATETYSRCIEIEGCVRSLATIPDTFPQGEPLHARLEDRRCIPPCD